MKETLKFLVCSKCGKEKVVEEFSLCGTLGHTVSGRAASKSTANQGAPRKRGRMDNPMYLRTKLSLRSWTKGEKNVTNLNLSVVPDDSIEHSRSLTPVANEITIGIPSDSDVGRNLTAGKTFYFDLVPTEAAQAAGRA
jgi:hypothetical protein